MENKSNIEFTYEGTKVDPETVGGDDQRVIEIIGLGSGRGFELKNVNLPKNWNESIDKLRNLDLKRFEEYNQRICEKWGFELDRIVFDPNKILKEMTIANKETKMVSRMYLSEIWFQEKGEYKADNLELVQPTMIFQEVAASYFTHAFGENFDYGYIHATPNAGSSSGYGPSHLKIPKKHFESDEILANDYQQNEFTNNAFNICGRFGLRLEDINFDKRGLLTSVSVHGDRTCYFLEEAGRYDNQFTSHNVDTSYQVLALHDIVASYINFLLDKK